MPPGVISSLKRRSFYYTLLYTSAIGFFGWRRIRRRRTPYVTLQTVSLFLIQLIPLFLLPEVLLPWMGYNGWFDAGVGRAVADAFFEMYIPVEEYLAGSWPEWRNCCGSCANWQRCCRRRCCCLMPRAASPGTIPRLRFCWGSKTVAIEAGNIDAAEQVSPGAR